MRTHQKDYVFFISHSTKDIGDAIGEICKIFEECKIRSFFADRDAPLGESLPDAIKKAIEASQLFLVFITRHSRKSPWVNQEIGYALGKEIPVIPIEKGMIKVKGLIESAKYVQMRDNPFSTVREIFSRLSGQPLSPEAQAAILAVVGILRLQKNSGGMT